MQISIDTLLKKNTYNTLNLIDIRPIEQYNKGHIINAKNIPVHDIMQEPEKYLNHRETYYFYCQSGHTSRQLVNILSSRGYHAYNVIGGYNNYLLWK